MKKQNDTFLEDIACTYTKLEKLDNWCFEHSSVYRGLYILWKDHLCPKMLKQKIIFFFQRKIRGFDDSETWNLDITFYKWLYPRLKRFAKVVQVYPTTYKDLQDWLDTLKQRSQQLNTILHTDEFDFDDWSYIPKKELTNLKKKHTNTLIINTTAFAYYVQDFNMWFIENINQLLW